MTAQPTTVHLVSLGCARNDVDSEELAGRLQAGGFRLVDDAAKATAVVVNTCGFIDTAKKDSVDTLLAAADLKQAGTTKAVVAVGCMAERYGRELAEALPEADAVLGFDDYAGIADRLNWILAGGRHEAHTPRDRRTLLPLAPRSRPAVADSIALPGHAPASGPRLNRSRLAGGPSAPLKIASGCDRRCAFCAIPTFRGAFISRPAGEIVTEARWLADHGVRELFLVSENSSSYGKDLGQLGALESLLAELSEIDQIEWIRVSYLQPAEIRPSLIEAMVATPKVVPYFDLSFQHAAPDVLRRMRRFGDPESLLGLIDRVRSLAPEAGIRSNVIVGFPGESERDVDVLADFISAARIDALGVFPYSDEEGTEGETLEGHLQESVIAERFDLISELAAEVANQRAEDRIGERVQIMIEELSPEGPLGRARHQGPEVDGTVRLEGTQREFRLGEVLWGRVTATEGVDLTACEEGSDVSG
jgi:ribosomal protein S12 methylthiotransferase RimO